MGLRFCLSHKVSEEANAGPQTRFGIASIIVNFMCWPGWATVCPDVYICGLWAKLIALQSGSYPNGWRPKWWGREEEQLLMSKRKFSSRQPSSFIWTISSSWLYSRQLQTQLKLSLSWFSRLWPVIRIQICQLPWSWEHTHLHVLFLYRTLTNTTRLQSSVLRF